MKSLLHTCFLFFISICVTFSKAHAQQAADPLQFTETVFSFGTIPQGKPVFHVFHVKNVSDKPVVIQDVQTSCGCTTPEWKREAIAPGASSEIKVGYNAAAEGDFGKFISVLYNGSLQKQIKIEGKVWAVPQGAAPLNASIQFLKQQLP